MAGLRFRGQTVDFNVDVSRLAREHPPLERVRNAMIDEGGDVGRVDQYLSHRLAAAFGKFGHDYMGEMSARIDRIFAIRDDLANSLDAALRGDSVHIDTLKTKFAELDRELNQLRSPTAAAKDAATLDAPRNLPPQTAPPDAPPPPAVGGGAGGRGPHPPDHLTQLARTEKVLDGLQVIEAQTAAPGLRSQIAAVAQTSPQTALKLLQGIARFLTPDNTQELQGLSHFLNQGGSPRALQRLLASRERFDSAKPTPDWMADLHFGLRSMREFDGEAARGVNLLLESNRYSASTVLRIFHNCQGVSGLVPGIFASLGRFENNRTIHRVVRFLATETNPEDFKAVQGQLLVANQMQDRFPDGLLVFEDPRLTPGGGRVADIVVWNLQGVVPLYIEVKYYTTLDSISARAREQLAKDLATNARVRRDLMGSYDLIPPMFAAMQWRFERGNLANELRPRLKREPTDADIKAEIQSRLQDAFTTHDAMLRNALGPDFDSYRAAFEGLPFVKLY